MSKKKTTESFSKELNEKFPNQFEVIGEYKNAKINIEIKHIVCGLTSFVSPTNLLSRGKCKHCSTSRVKSGMTRRLDISTVKERIHSIDNGQYEMIGEYKGSKKDVEMLHKKCGNIFETKPHNFFINNTRCPFCSRKEGARKTLETKITNGTLLSMNTEIFKREMTTVDKEIEVLGEYRGKQRKIEVVHTRCGYKWTPYADNLLRGSGCPNCNQAGKTENEIYEILINKFGKENVVRQKKFEELKGLGGGLLSYDFFVNNSFLIEYNGEQHYHIGRFRNGEDEFNKQQKHDLLKKEFAENKNIPLITIPYWEKENTEKIIDRLII